LAIAARLRPAHEFPVPFIVQLKNSYICFEMSRFKKALERLEKKPKDFTWPELQVIMKRFGYEEYSNSGSARRFYNAKTNASVHLHEPHPETTMKRYALEIIIEHLIEQKLL